MSDDRDQDTGGPSRRRRNRQGAREGWFDLSPNSPQGTFLQDPRPAAASSSFQAAQEPPFQAFPRPAQPAVEPTFQTPQHQQVPKMSSSQAQHYSQLPMEPAFQAPEYYQQSLKESSSQMPQPPMEPGFQTPQYHQQLPKKASSQASQDYPNAPMEPAFQAPLHHHQQPMESSFQKPMPTHAPKQATSGQSGWVSQQHVVPPAVGHSGSQSQSGVMPSDASHTSASQPQSQPLLSEKQQVPPIDKKGTSSTENQQPPSVEKDTTTKDHPPSSPKSVPTPHPRPPWIGTITPMNINLLALFGIGLIILLFLHRMTNAFSTLSVALSSIIASIFAPEARIIPLSPRTAPIVLINYTDTMIPIAEASDERIRYYLKMLSLEESLDDYVFPTEGLKALVDESENLGKSFTQSLASSDTVMGGILADLQDEPPESDEEDQSWTAWFLRLFTRSRQRRFQDHLSQLTEIMGPSVDHRKTFAKDLTSLQQNFATRVTQPLCNLFESFNTKRENIHMNPVHAKPIVRPDNGTSAAQHELEPLSRVVDALEACCALAKEGAKQLAVQRERVGREVKFLETERPKLKSELRGLRKTKGRAGKNQLRRVKGVIETFIQNWDWYLERYFDGKDNFKEM